MNEDTTFNRLRLKEIITHVDMNIVKDISIYISEVGRACPARLFRQILPEFLPSEGKVFSPQANPIGIGILGIPDHTSEKNPGSRIAQKMPGDYSLVSVSVIT